MIMALIIFYFKKCSGVWRMSGGDDRFDLLVIDEASQMPVTAASCAVQLLKTGAEGHGRLIVVGDEHQLPPVSKGSYAERSLVFDRYEPL
jgi:superfamily I DNA and/or RNA helicase